jgi:hypothetical protein
MSIIPRFKLYESDGLTLRYTFEVVQETNAPQTTIKNTVIEGMRGQGCIIIPGSAGSWELIIRGIFLAADYEAITTKIDGLESAIVAGEKYVLTFDKHTPGSGISSIYQYNVIRVTPIEYPESLRTDYQEYKVIFKANSW